MYRKETRESEFVMRSGELLYRLNVESYREREWEENQKRERGTLNSHHGPDDRHSAAHDTSGDDSPCDELYEQERSHDRVDTRRDPAKRKAAMRRDAREVQVGSGARVPAEEVRVETSSMRR